MIMDSILGNNTGVLADLPLRQAGHSKGFKEQKSDRLLDNLCSSGTYQYYKTVDCYGINHNLIIHQMDVKIAFLNGDLDEEQAPKQWHQKFDEVVLSNGGTLVPDQVQVDLTKEFLSSRFSMKDMGKADVILVGKLSSTLVILWMGIPAWCGAISWASKKQTCITGSTKKSEFVALAAAGKEVEWLKNLLLEIPLWSKPIAPISICCDSAATLAKAYSQMYNGKSRHLGVRHSMIRELITNGVVSIEFVRSQQNYLVDPANEGTLARDLL
ncbi:hypothetical protein Tco_0771118 [Tanacetum coccineum]|uniref:Zinc finger, CCHC-type n=1 Tax=Tanacetum coccineum TaxID=301880 RepID=A0ABQ4ZHN6_9ASTR